MLAWSLLRAPEASVTTVIVRDGTPSTAGRPGLAALPPPTGSLTAAARPLSPLVPFSDAQEADVGLATSLDTAFDVNVVRADGTPAEGADIVVTAHGAARADEYSWPRGTTDANGNVRIPLPAGGRYDIGARDGVATALAADLAAAGGSRTQVRLRLPEMATVEFRLEPGLECSYHRVEFHRDPADPPPWPAAVEEKATHTWALIDRKGKDGVGPGPLALPKGVRFRVRCRCSGAGQRPQCPVPATVDPSVVAAPATIRILLSSDRPGAASEGETVSILANVTCTEPAPGNSRARIHFVVSPEHGGRSEENMDVVFVDGEAVAEWLDGRAPKGGSTLVEWSGEGVVPGRSRVNVPEDSEDRVELDVTCARSMSALQGVEVVDPAGVPIPANGRDGVRWSAWSGSDQLTLGEREEDDPGWRSEMPAWGGRTATVTFGAWWTSSPVALPITGTARVPLERGGLLLIHMRVPPPPAAGPLRIERLDGGPVLEIPTQDMYVTMADEGGSRPLQIHPGSVLGPLPTGDVPLRATLGGVEIGRVVAKVKAGEVTVLSLK